jgi:hypothetical protein
LNVKLEQTKIKQMDAEKNDETGQSTEQGTPEPTKETPRFRLRDLRPEKDPIGAGGKRFPKSGVGSAARR